MSELVSRFATAQDAQNDKSPKGDDFRLCMKQANDDGKTGNDHLRLSAVFGGLAIASAFATEGLSLLVVGAIGSGANGGLGLGLKQSATRQAKACLEAYNSTR